MRYYKLGEEDKNRIEDFSLQLLEDLLKRFDILVIGGWAVRGLSVKHFRHTFDVDGICHPTLLRDVYSYLEARDFNYEKRFFGKAFKAPLQLGENTREIGIQISGPKIFTRDRRTYFLFDLSDTIQIIIGSLTGIRIQARSPSSEQIVANKLSFGGWKSVYDLGTLFERADQERVISILERQPAAYREKVLRNVPRFRNIINKPSRGLEATITNMLGEIVNLKKLDSWLLELSKKVRSRHPRELH